MTSFLLTLLSSAGFGSIIGLVGGIINRFIDIKAKEGERAFELTKLDKERDYMKEEYAARNQLATIEGEARVEANAYTAMAESYKFAAPSSSNDMVDKITRTIRPILTVLFFVFTCIVFAIVTSLIVDLKTAFSAAEILVIWKQIIEWVFFQAGVSIGWWFAMRPGKMPTFGV